MVCLSRKGCVKRRILEYLHCLRHREGEGRDPEGQRWSPSDNDLSASGGWILELFAISLCLYQGEKEGVGSEGQRWSQRDTPLVCVRMEGWIHWQRKEKGSEGGAVCILRVEREGPCWGTTLSVETLTQGSDLSRSTSEPL